MNISSDFLLKNNDLNQEFLVQISCFDETTGIPDEIYLKLKEKIQEGKLTLNERKKIQALCPLIGILALESGHYQLAVDLGLDSEYDQLRAILFLGKKEQANELLEKLKLKNRRALCIAAEAQILRMNGKAHLGLNLFQTFDDSFLQDLNPWHLGEFYLQWGSCLFNTSQAKEASKIYQKAYNIFCKKNLKGKMAIAAFNVAVCFQNINQKVEQASWLEIAQNHLSNYYLKNLEITMQLFQIENAVNAQEYRSVIQKSLKFLEEKNLSLVQKVLGLQALTEALTEEGLLLEAEFRASEVRQIISQNQFYQYEKFQLALELNIEVLTHRQILRHRYFNNPNQELNKRASIKYKEAQIRKSFTLLDFSRIEKIFKEIQKLDSSFYSDEFQIINQKLNWSKKAREQELFFWNTLFEGRQTQMQWFMCQISNIPDKNPWQNILMLISKSCLKYELENKDKAKWLALEALKECEKFGHEKLATFLMGLLAQIDKEYEGRFLNHVRYLEEFDKEFLARAYKGFFKKNFMLNKWILSDNQIQLVNAKFDSNSLVTSDNAKEINLIIEQGKSEIICKGEKINLSRSTILVQILEYFTRNKNIGFTKEEIIKEIWGYEYNPLVHDSLIYTNINRLREIVEIDLKNNKYRIASGMSWIYITQTEEFGMKFNENFREIIKFIKDSKQILSRKKVVKILNVSERTALRVLTQMVNKKLLRKQGQGRGVVYLLNPEGSLV